MNDVLIGPDSAAIIMAVGLVVSILQTILKYVGLVAPGYVGNQILQRVIALVLSIGAAVVVVLAAPDFAPDSAQDWLQAGLIVLIAQQAIYALVVKTIESQIPVPTPPPPTPPQTP